MSQSKVKGKTEILQLLSIILNTSADIVMYIMAQICSKITCTLN